MQARVGLSNCGQCGFGACYDSFPFPLPEMVPCGKSDSVGFTNEIDLESLRARLRKVSDQELICLHRLLILGSRRAGRSWFNLKKLGRNGDGAIQNWC